jgi:hypothetical protein
MYSGGGAGCYVYDKCAEEQISDSLNAGMKTASA